MADLIGPRVFQLRVAAVPADETRLAASVWVLCRPSVAGDPLEAVSGVQQLNERLTAVPAQHQLVRVGLRHGNTS